MSLAAGEIAEALVRGDRQGSLEQAPLRSGRWFDSCEAARSSPNVSGPEVLGSSWSIGVMWLSFATVQVAPSCRDTGVVVLLPGATLEAEGSVRGRAIGCGVPLQLSHGTCSSLAWLW